MYRFVSPCFVIILCVICSCEGSHLTFGHIPDNSESATIAIFVQFSYNKCYKACLARKHCLSIELTIRSNLCRLLSVDSTTSGFSLVIKPGTVYTEKRNWSVKTLSQACDDSCDVGKTCLDESNSPQCDYEECGPAALVADNSKIKGNMMMVHSKIDHVCDNDPTKRNSSECRSDGTWSSVTLQCAIDCGSTFPNGQLTDTSQTTVGATSGYTCSAGFFPGDSTVTCQDSGEWGPGECKPLLTTLSGSVFRIVTFSTGRWWHYDASVSQKWVTVKWQPSDNFVKFRFDEVTSGVYKIMTMATYQYLYDGGDYLNTLQSPDDDYQRFMVFKESEYTYRIVLKATGSYVRVDEDQQVSSEQNKKDVHSLFYFQAA